jgi:hypothetical protein
MRAHPHVVLPRLGDGTSGQRGANLVEEELRHLVHLDLSHRW